MFMAASGVICSRIPKKAYPFRLRPQPLVCLRRQPAGDHFLESGVVHEPGKDLFVLIHPLHEEGFEEVLEDQFKFVAGIDDGGLLEGFVGGCRFDYLIEEELVA